MASKHVVAKFLTLTFGLIVPVYIAAQTPQFTIQDVGTLPDLPACNGTAISQSGNVAGYCTATFGQDLLLNNITTHVSIFQRSADRSECHLPTDRSSPHRGE
jgi:hypothetical protein